MKNVLKQKFRSALDLNGKIIHIDVADSGNNGYFCKGCQGTMIACKGDVNDHHFRHHPKDIEKHRNCTFKDETYRHLKAKEIIQILRKVKVPNVYISIPEEFGGGRQLISKSKFIEGYEIGIERYIYEDQNGKIKISKVPFVGQDKHLFINPDIIFFDENKIPVLIIEVCATHKVDVEKKAKLIRLGIDSIEIKIPEYYTPLDIEQNFLVTENTKWLFNNEQSKTNYIPDPTRDQRRSDKVDGDEGEISLGEETSSCRSHRLRDVIRGITKCLGDPKFGEQRKYLDTEISRVEGNTKSIREEYERRIRNLESEVRTEAIRIEQQISVLGHILGDESGRARTEAEGRIPTEIKDNIGEEESAISKLERDAKGEQEYYQELEDRYFDKEEQIERIAKAISNRFDIAKKYYGREGDLIEIDIQGIEGQIFDFELAISSDESKQKQLDIEIEKKATDLQYYRQIRNRAISETEGQRTIIEGVDRKIESIAERRRRIKAIREKLCAAQDEALFRRYNKSE